MNKSTGTRNLEKNLRRGGTNTTLIKDQIMLQGKSHFIADFKYGKCLYRAL